MATTTENIKFSRPSYKAGKSIPTPDALKFHNNYGEVRLVRENGRLVRYEQYVVKEFPALDINGTPADVGLLLVLESKGLEEAKMGFKILEKIQDSHLPYLVIEGWELMNHDAVTAFKAVVEHEKDLKRRDKKAAQLEAEAQKLRRS